MHLSLDNPTCVSPYTVRQTTGSARIDRIDGASGDGPRRRPGAAAALRSIAERYRRSVKVLVAHNRYQSAFPSGENEVVDAEIDQLRRAGVAVIPYIRSSDEIAYMGTKDRIFLPFMPMHSRRATAEVISLLEQHQPDLVHLHNPYPLISLSIVRAAHEHGVPVVQTVHNHRHSCARGSFFRDGHPCFECQGKALPWPAVQHGCYRDSRVQSVALATALYTHRQDQRDMDRYIALSPPIAESLHNSGLVRPDQVIIRPNSVPDPGPAIPPGKGLLFAGRLSREKGILLLLDAWQHSGRPFGTLTIAGDGPERAQVEASAAATDSGVAFLGPQDREGVNRAFKACAALVVPSTAPEALPLVVLEALSHARPVIASNIGGLVSVVDESVGWLTTPDIASLSATLNRAAASDLAQLGRTARAAYERTYTPGVVTAQQIAIYKAVVAAHRSTVARHDTGPPRSSPSTGDEPQVPSPRIRVPSLHVAVNACFVSHSRVGGAEQMVLNLLEGLDGSAADATSALGPVDVVSREALVGCEHWAALRARVLSRGQAVHRMAFEALMLPRLPRPDIWLHTNYFTPPRLKCPSVTVIHDAQYAHFPQYFSPAKRAWLWAAQHQTLSRAREVVAISEFTRLDLLDRFGAKYEPKIHVVPNAVSFDRLDSGSELAPSGDEPYVLAVAAQYPHKNLRTLLSAHAIVARTREVRLLLVGQYSKELTGGVADVGNLEVSSPGVEFTGFVSDARLGALYRGASVFVLPSLFEGFGLPVIEALGLRIPTVTTRRGAIPEVGEGYPIYVDDPLSAEEMAEAIIWAMDNPDTARPTENEAEQLRDKYSPARVASAYLDLLRSVT